MFGRQLANPQMGLPIMDKFYEMLSDIAELTSKPEINGRQINEGHDDRNTRDEKIFRAVVRQLAHLKEVGGDAGHNTTGLVIVIKAEGELLQVVEQVAAHLRLHTYADGVTVILHEIAQKHTQHVKRQHDAARHDDGGIHFVRDVFVEHLSRHDGIDHTDHRNEKRRQHIQGQHLFVWLVIGDESF